MTRALIASVAFVVIVALCTSWHYFDKPAHAVALSRSDAQAVTVSTPLEREVQDSTVFTGEFSAIDDVDIRAQVSGYLMEIAVTDGQMVTQGQLLFVIDPRPYQIQLEQAQAAVKTANAQLTFARKETQRIGSLQNSGAVTHEQFDQKIEIQEAAEASLSQADADVASAQLNLEFCHIKAPFSGQISNHRLSLGALVVGGPNASTSSVLTTLVSLDPIHLDFQMSESDYLQYAKYTRASRKLADVRGTVEAELSDEQGFPRLGQLNFIDNKLDPGSGTIHVRATFSNPDFALMPGLFAQVRLPTSSSARVLLVPDSSLTPDQSNEIVMTVTPDNKVVPKIVQTGALSEGLREVLSGLSSSDRVIIDGLVRVEPGAVVAPKIGEIAPTLSN